VVPRLITIRNRNRSTRYYATMKTCVVVVSTTSM